MYQDLQGVHASVQNLIQIRGLHFFSIFESSLFDFCGSIGGLISISSGFIRSPPLYLYNYYYEFIIIMNFCLNACMTFLSVYSIFSCYGILSMAFILVCHVINYSGNK